MGAAFGSAVSRLILPVATLTIVNAGAVMKWRGQSWPQITTVTSPNTKGLADSEKVPLSGARCETVCRR